MPTPQLTGVILDTASLDRDDLDFSPLLDLPVQWTFHRRTSPSQRRDHIADADIVVCNKVVIDAETLEACPGIQLVCVLATGLNNIDLEACTARGIAVKNVRGYGTASVAQHVFSLILTLARSLPQYGEAVARGDWSRSEDFCLLDYPIDDLSEKTLGIVGYGELGRAVATLGEAFGMRIIIAERPGATTCRPGRCSFAETLKNADILSLHCPLTEDNHHLIDAAALAAMKPTAWLINTARGPLVDETALLYALDQGIIAAAALDVLSTEPPPADHPLLQHPRANLLITPHIAWAARSARQNIIRLTAENIRDHLQRHDPL